MPAPNDGQLLTQAWENVVGDSPEDNIHDDYWVLARLKKNGGFESFDGGRNIMPSLEYALNSTVASYSDTETISTTRVDVFDQADFAWKEYAGTAVQSELEDAINQGRGGKFKLLAAKLKNLDRSFDGLLNADLFSDGTGNSSKQIGGFQHIIATAPTSGTVGGINRASFTFWRNQQTSGAKTTSAFDNLRASMRSIYNLCSNGVASTHPKAAVTDRTVFQGYEGLLTANERFTSKEDGDAGFKNEVIKFKGAKLAYDNDCTASALYFWAEEFLKFAYLKGRYKKALAVVEPSNQTVKVFRVVTIGNLFTNNARRLGVVTAIT